MSEAEIDLLDFAKLTPPAGCLQRRNKSCFMSMDKFCPWHIVLSEELELKIDESSALFRDFVYISISRTKAAPFFSRPFELRVINVIRHRVLTTSTAAMTFPVREKGPGSSSDQARILSLNGL